MAKAGRGIARGGLSQRSGSISQRGQLQQRAQLQQRSPLQNRSPQRSPSLSQRSSPLPQRTSMPQRSPLPQRTSLSQKNTNRNAFSLKKRNHQLSQKRHSTGESENIEQTKQPSTFLDVKVSYHFNHFFL